jgi:hypothetical protein
VPSAPLVADAVGKGDDIQTEYRGVVDVEPAEGAVVDRSLLDSRAADKRRLPSTSLVEWGK